MFNERLRFFVQEMWVMWTHLYLWKINQTGCSFSRLIGTLCTFHSVIQFPPPPNINSSEVLIDYFWIRTFGTLPAGTGNQYSWCWTWVRTVVGFTQPKNNKYPHQLTSVLDIKLTLTLDVELRLNFSHPKSHLKFNQISMSTIHHQKHQWHQWSFSFKNGKSGTLAFN